MLSDEEEKARALKVSQLYLQPLKRRTNATSWMETFSWSVTLRASIFLTIPAVFANTLYDFYFLSTYTHLADLQAASMIFIALLMATAGLFIVCLRASFNTIYNRYAVGRTIFLLSLIAAISTIPFIRVLTTGSTGQELIELVARCAAFAGLSFIVTIIIFTVITKLLLRFTKQN